MTRHLISKSGFGGACVLSALGSLPLHVMPIVVAAAMYTDRVTFAQAGLISGMYSFGQLLIAILLPLLTVLSISRWLSSITCCVLVLLLWLHAQAGLMLFILSWAFIGACAGVLNYLGVTAAAAAEDKSTAFTTRLGVTLLIAGLTMMAFFTFDSTPDYTEITVKLGITVAVLAVGGSIFYRQPTTSILKEHSELDDEVVESNSHARQGLVLLFLFIVAQIGFIVFVVDSATHRGIDVVDAMLAIAMCKIIAAGVLLLFANDPRLTPNPITGNLLLPIVLLATGIYLIANTTSILCFLLGFLLWESAVNLLSAAFQAGVVMMSPRTGSMFLSCVILSGAAVGPVLHSLAASFGAQQYFYYFVMLSVFLPLVWNRQLVSNRVRAEQL